MLDSLQLSEIIANPIRNKKMDWVSIYFIKILQQVQKGFHKGRGVKAREKGEDRKHNKRGLRRDVYTIDIPGKSDPYVKLRLTEEKLPSKKTTVKHTNLNPEWNEEFKLVVKDPETQALELTIYDGTEALTRDEPKTLTLDLLKTMDPSDAQNGKSRGQIVLEVTCKPFKEADLPKVSSMDVVQEAPVGTSAGGGLLVVIVHEAQDLEGKYHTNPYMRIMFRGEEKKTKCRKKSRDPRWEEEFQFVCEEPPIHDKMHVKVLNRPPSIGIHSKESLAYVAISLADVVSNRRINEKYHLIDSKHGLIQIKLQWRTYNVS